MGVPALFRWLSKKYPKVVEQVIEDVPAQNAVDGGTEEVPIDMSQRNPNGMEFDNLYLDMNGIVHPCTHPEGKKPPETEAEMMIEVFKYTERVVNMVRPRKLLMIAIDGVAPRAKMNQQRSRRFRAAQEAKVKEEEKQALIEEYKQQGKELPEDYKTDKKAWDSNAITPGTPFMTLLTESLRYWIVYKMNTDKGWSQIQVILSDASVPGEGEHKIMDFVRRQRTQPSYDPNTKHVIYGLDADLIMLSLATHEPHFKVLREDVFADQKKGKGCYTCGQLGHHSSQCQGKPKEKVDEHDTKQKPVERKPFIFLDVGILREYLAIELNIGGLPFPFDIERAIDDWVLLIFFVGNDFLPHLPSLEIREGAIDTLLKIWKTNLGRMGGFLTDCGALNLKRTEIILEGLASREDEIFRRRREAEERQDQSAKRRKIDDDNKQVHIKSSTTNQPLPTSNLGNLSTTLNVPLKPTFLPEDVRQTTQSAIPGLGNASLSMMSNADVVKNRFAIRTANMDAAAMLKAELSGTLELPTSAPAGDDATKMTMESTDVALAESQVPLEANTETPGVTQAESDAPTGTQNPSNESHSAIDTSQGKPSNAENDESAATTNGKDSCQDSAAGPPDGETESTVKPPTPVQKRKADELESADPAIGPIDDSVVLSEDEDEDEAPGDVSVFVPGEPSRPAPLKMLGNNMVEQDDTVKLWEPGYRERYFRQKFGIELNDEVEKRKIVKHYVEGLAWVLAYYYQGCQSWQWFYPYHYSPFASDFTNLEEFEIKFNLGQPFKPYEQLMGVFPAASRCHIPDVYHDLMMNDDSPIKDFYPEEFEIDMNGKKMLWQGVALLPFIEQDRLLNSMKDCEDRLAPEDKIRNEPGHVVMFCGEAHPQYENFCKIYQKRDNKEAVTLDPAHANGVFGSALPDPDCIPGSTFYSPLPTVGLPDISNDKSIFARFFVPSQLVPHRSLLLSGVALERPILNNHDRDLTRRGGNQAHGGNQHYGSDGFHQQRRDFGDGPGIMTHYHTNNSNFNGGGGGYWNSNRGSGNHSQYQQPHHSTHAHDYRNSGPPAGNHRGYSNGPAHHHHNGYPQGGHHSQRAPYGLPTSFGSTNARGGGGYRPPHSAPQSSYYNAPMNHNNGGYVPPVRYGGTGVGLPQRAPPAPFADPYPPPTQSSTHYSRAGYRPPGITPAFTRTVPNYPPRAAQQPSRPPYDHSSGR
ncbi:5'-3' exoribonuclease 2 [Puccinia graminis f. sp. tritici]|uniref:5'-3' exoribonuclease n=2 Tax=Puccinia graminis f. sp. tritici TaxID=56615 RepID=E3K529_PUCGT|nr:uncharacterized protein PGTG_05665 [Puccinia graminis f. sp. tritici CRL 75-36-700-3]EFP79344.2 hypothetical protein PGTG_05665 [Puccinia graminis f. sp. tritici CRL 75-36-700-3]KAA1085129.1 5'-3' exoribonuclease 2 [Puccinia graminis f. sp. tritici]